VWVRNVRVQDCTIDGGLIIESAVDVIVRNCRIINDGAFNTYAPILVAFFCNNIQILDNYIYDRTTATSARHDAAIQVWADGSGATAMQPSNIVVKGNKIHVQNGWDGVQIMGTGSRSHNSANLDDETNTATSVTATTLVRTGAGWTTDQWQGQWQGRFVRVGTAIAGIASNTCDTLTLFVPAGRSTAWYTELGGRVATPTGTPSYTIFGIDGIVTVEDNDVECTNYGHGAGGSGVYLEATQANMRVHVRNNRIKNANGSAIVVESSNSARAFKELVIEGNTFWDDQLTPTCDTGIEFTATRYVDYLVMSGNRSRGTIVPVTGLDDGVWLEVDGYPQQWAGWAAPNGVISAKIGSTFRRLDPGGAAALWVKQSDDGGDQGWVRLTKPDAKLWDVDDGSGIGVPSTTAQWNEVLEAAGLAGVVTAPALLLLCQEASGNLADSIGSFTFTAVGASLAYQQNCAPWSRLGVKTTDNSAHGWENTSASLPDASVGAITMVVYAKRVTQVTPNVNRQIIGIGTSGTTTEAYIGGASQTRVKSGNAAAATGTDTTWNAVRPYILRHDTPNTDTDGFTDAEKTVATYSSGVTGKRVVLGSDGVAAAGAAYLYAFGWLSSITDAQLRAILRVLGWTILW
jgi:hypothetical protein